MIQLLIAKLVIRGVMIIGALFIVEYFTPMNLFSQFIGIVEPIIMDWIGPYIRDWAIDQFNPF